MSDKVIKLQKYLKDMGFKKEASFLLWLLGACKSENKLVSLKPGNSSGSNSDTGSWFDTGNEDEITIEDMPPCVQTISWLPSPEDPRWSGDGVPLSEFKVVGRDGVSIGFSEEETVVGATKGDLSSIFMLITQIGSVQCAWAYVCDLDGYWSSSYNTWDYVRENDDGTEDHGMDIIYSYYDEAPLIRVQVNFPIQEIDGVMHVSLPDRSGGNVSHHGLDDECVQEYLEAIGEEISGDTGE